LKGFRKDDYNAKVMTGEHKQAAVEPFNGDQSDTTRLEEREWRVAKIALIFMVVWIVLIIFLAYTGLLPAFPEDGINTPL
jgi:hypothetical protein